MKKQLSLLLALLLALSVTACGGSQTAAEGKPQEETNQPASPADSGEADHTQGETMTWILPQTQNEDNPSCIASYAFADAMKEATGGRWTIEVYVGGSMGSENETLEMCRVNTIQIVPANISSMEQYVPDFGVFVLPYLFHSWEDFETYVSTSTKCADLWGRLEDATNLKFVSIMNNGTRWMVFLGISYSTLHDNNIRVTVVANALFKGTANQVLNILIYLLTFGVFAWIFTTGIQYIGYCSVVKTPAMQLPRSWFVTILPLTGFLMILRSGYKIFISVKELFTHMDKEVPT